MHECAYCPFFLRARFYFDIPLDVLFTTTDTPGRKLPISSTTCPETRTVCEHKKLVMNTNTTGNNFKNNTLNLFMIIF